MGAVQKSIKEDAKREPQRLRKEVNRWQVMRAVLEISSVFLMYFILLDFYICSALSSPIYSPSCHLLGQFHLNRMHKAGDVILGGLFQIHLFSMVPDLSFTSEPQQPTCHG